jgi:iron complex transport system ATP-binding protein
VALMLSCDRLSVGFPGRTLCRELSLELRPGECWGILGMNGSGKTTVLHTLGGLRAPRGGSVELNGRAIRSFAARELARSLGVLLQEEPGTFWGSLLEYVLLGRHPHSHSLFGWGAEDMEHAEQALARMDLAGLSDRPLASLSGGERQRARIALLLAQAPRVYLLDEPLQHLDLRHQLEAMQAFRALAQRNRCALATVLHDTLWASRFCDHVLLLPDDGEALAGPAETLLTREVLERVFRCGLREYGTDAERHFLPGDGARV